MEVNVRQIAKLGDISLKLLPLILILLVSLLYSHTLSDLAERWMKWDENLSHGFIIVAAFLYFLFKAAPISSTSDSAPLKASALFALTTLSLAWYITKITNIYILEQMSLIGIIVLLFTTLFGFNATRQHIFLLLLPIFSIPIWDQLNNTLVSWSGVIVGGLVRFIEMPAVIDGNSIFIPDGEIVIADGCSGLRYFTISLAIGYLISYLNNYSLKKLSLLLLVAAGIGLLTNWLRIFLLVIIGYETKMQSSLMSDHEYFGWILFAVIAFPAIYFSPVIKTSIKKNDPLPPSLLWLSLSIAALVTGPVLLRIFSHDPIPLKIMAQLGHEYRPILENKMPSRILIADSTMIENAIDTDQIYMQINHFQRKHSSEKLVPYTVRLFDHETWSIQADRNLTIDQLNMKIQVFRNKRSGAVIAQGQWFEIAGETTASYTIAKLLQIPAIMNNMNSFTIYTTQVNCEEVTCNGEIDKLIVRSQSLAIRN